MQILDTNTKHLIRINCPALHNYSTAFYDPGLSMLISQYHIGWVTFLFQSLQPYWGKTFSSQLGQRTEKYQLWYVHWIKHFLQSLQSSYEYRNKSHRQTHKY